MQRWNTLKRKICPACRHYRPEQEVCALLANGAREPNLKELLDGQRCDPESFLRAYITRYIAAKYGPAFGDAVDPVLNEVMLRLRSLEGNPFPVAEAVKDLDRFREWAMSFAREAVIRYLGRTFTAPTCGICDHYHRTQPTLCQLQYVPDENGGTRRHPWFAHRLPPDQDPQALDPPCAQFISAQWTAYRQATAPPPRADLNVYGMRNVFDALQPDELEPMLVSLLERLERRSLRMEYIVRRVFFYNATPEDVARELGTHTWIVRRELDRSLEVLRQLLTQGKLDDPTRTLD